MERMAMNLEREIIYRSRSGQSERAIVRDLRLSRPTVHKYRQMAAGEGHLEEGRELPENAELSCELGPAPRPPRAPSTLEGYRDVVQSFVDQGLEMSAMFQRLREDHGYRGSYSSVRRFVHRLEEQEPEAYTRVHCAPGEEMQVDFGSVGPIYDPQRHQPRKAYAFVATLSYSRHPYAEIVFDQKVPTWIGLHKRALAFFGGVPQRVVLDNLKSAVTQALAFDPLLGEAYRRLAQHYGFLISPNRPATPRHKGKVENGVHYDQRNFMADQQFVDLDRTNQRLKDWVLGTAGLRDHGTTHRQPLELFNLQERAALQPLPAEPFDLCEVRTAKVHTDCHIQGEQSYYSVPYRLVGTEVEMHVHEHTLEVYAGQELVRTHPRSAAKGAWSTVSEDYPPYKARYLLETPQYCRREAERIGPHTAQVVAELLADRPLDRLRSVQGILRLAEGVGEKRLEAACERALRYHDLRYRSIKAILNSAQDREPLPEEPVSPAHAQAFAFARPAQTFFEPAQERP